MMNKTPGDRLQENALKLLPGPLARLQYMADLRGDDGQYSHWGLARMYTESELQRGLDETHNRVLTDVLCCPLFELEREMRTAGPAAASASALSKKFKALMPQVPCDANKQHLKLVLFVLSCLDQRPSSNEEPVSC